MRVQYNSSAAKAGVSIGSLYLVRALVGTHYRPPAAKSLAGVIDKRGSRIEGNFVAVKDSEFNNQQASTTPEVKA